MSHPKHISIVVPVYNESAGLPAFHDSLLAVIHMHKLDVSEILYCDDGSSDNTPEIIQGWHQQDAKVKLLRFSRNFGKEYALTAGITAARGDAIITIDGDGQHPVELLPDFIGAWQQGKKVVVGVRTDTGNVGWLKRATSRAFYRIYNSLAQQHIIAGTTDYCLIDAGVQREFVKLQESQRITRTLIDWLGFDRAYIYFAAKSREHGQPTYSTKKLLYAAANGLISMSTVPLYIFGVVGFLITTVSLLLGGAVLIEQYLLNDPLSWNFTGTAQLSILLLFLVGVVLVSQGLLALYISHIHNQSQRRPLYVIDYAQSAGVHES